MSLLSRLDLLPAFRRPLAFAVLALSLAPAGCGLFGCPARPPLTSTAAPNATPSEPPVGLPADPTASGASPPAPKQTPAEERDWAPATAPAAVVDAVVNERAAFAPGDGPVFLTGMALASGSGGGGRSWIVSGEGRERRFNTPLWAFLERRGRWTNLGFLGSGYIVLPAGPAPPRGYAPLCVYALSVDEHVATEFAWDGARYQSGERYELEAGTGRLCELALLQAGG